MLKSFRLLLLAVLTMVCGSMMAQEETTVTWEASSGAPLTTIYPDANISFVWEEGGGDFAPKYTNGSVYFYNGNRVKIAGTASDVTIKKIVFTFTGERYSMVTCDKSGKNESTAGITNSPATMTSTWEGEAASLIFRAPKQTSARYISSIAVTYTGGTTGPVETAPKLAITQDGIADTYDMDANAVFVVYYENQGTATAENAKLTLYVDGAENASKIIGTLAIGSSNQNFWNAKYDVTKLEAGEHSVKLSLTADDCEAVEIEKTVTFTKKAPEATFSISASNVTVPYDATEFTVVALLTNTSEVEGTDIKVELRKGISEVVAEATVASLAAGADTNVSLTVEGGPFEEGSKDYYLYVNGNYLAPVTVTVEAAPVVDVYDLAITSISGTLKLENATNNVRVIVQNNGNVAITDAPITLKAGETVLASATVSANAGQTGWADFAVASEGLTAGTLEVTATVTVEGDATPADNTLTQELTVSPAPIAEPTYSLSAEDIEMKDGEGATAIVKVTNTSEYNVTGLEVKLLYGITTVATQTVDIAAGETKDVEFNVTADVVSAILAALGGKTSAEIQAVAGHNSCFFTVTVVEEVEPVIDMALTQIQGVTEINLKEENKVMVWYQNNGNVATTATISASLNGTALEAQIVENVPAEGQGYVEFTLPTEGLTAGETTTFEATITATDDVDDSNNSQTKELAIVSGEAEPQAEIAISAVGSMEVQAGEQTVTFSVEVTNNGDADAENVEINVYKSYPTMLDTKTISLEAGETTTVTFSFAYTFEQGQDVEFTVQTLYSDADPENNTQRFTISCPDDTTTAIQTIKAFYRQNVTIYTLSGVKVSSVRPGNIYIVNGRKIVVK